MVPLLSSVAERVKERRRAVQEMERVDHHTANLDAACSSLHEKRAVKVREALSILFAKSTAWPSLTVSEWEIVEALCKILEPMVEPITLAKARGMTASAVIPLTKLMISDMESASEYPAATQAIANKLRVGLQKYEEVEYLNIASALDPRFKVCSQFV
ncbi:hypothetical protein Q1695_000734 [Nippostrongylus brasiliensis]|nr:hypothetical protein Q1695_000734 [Nippostrongylus brasiliensis]